MPFFFWRLLGEIRRYGTNLSGAQKKMASTVIFIIDGAGFQHMSGLFHMYKQTYGQEPGFTQVAMVNTSPKHVKTPSNRPTIADSASGATALATGRQVKPGVVSIDTTTRRHYPTLLEKARKRGYKVAVVTTANVTDATPACFLAHAIDRSHKSSILNQVCAFKPDCLVGGVSSPSMYSKLRRAYGESQTINLRDCQNSPAGTARVLDHCVSAAPHKPLVMCYGDEIRTGHKDRGVPISIILPAVLARYAGDKMVLMVEAAHIDKCAHGEDLRCWRTEANDVVDMLYTLVNYCKSESINLVVTADHNTGSLYVTDTKTTLSGPNHNGHHVAAFGLHNNNQKIPPIVTQPELGKYLSKLIF